MRTSIVGCAIALAACSTPAPPDPPAPVPRVLVEIDRARCERAIRCEPVLGNAARREQREHCAATEDRHALTAERIAAGDLRIDDAAAAQCLETLGAEDCNLSLSPCWGVVEGAHAEGERCDDDAECVDGTRCAFGLECPHVCERLVPHGQPCDETTWCEETCSIPEGSTTGECRPWEDVRGPCGSDDDCWPYGECLDGHCAPYTSAIGDECLFWFGTFICVDGLVCDPMTARCGPPPREGEACDPYAPYDVCAEGLYCSVRTCEPLRREGESCRIDEQCAPGAPYCVDGTCVDEPSGNECERASDCPEDYACVFLVAMTCQHRVSAGRLCVADAHCQEGMRCLDGTCRAIARPGEACRSELECPDSFLCDAGRCVPPPPREVCDPCSAGGCAGEVCVPDEIVPLGGDCGDAGTACVDGARCETMEPDDETYRCVPSCS